MAMGPVRGPLLVPLLRTPLIAASLCTELQEICELIGLDPGTLEQALCSRTVKARDEMVLTTLSVPQVSTPHCSTQRPQEQSQEPPLCPLHRDTMAGMHWPRTSTAASSTGW